MLRYGRRAPGWLGWTRPSGLLHAQVGRNVHVATFDVFADSQASAEHVWGLLLDPRSWPEWSPIDELVIDQSTGLGHHHAHTVVGSVRAYRTGDAVSGERILELEPLRRMVYQDAFNDALHDYRAIIELTPTSTGTHIQWRGSYTPVPGLEAVLPDYLKSFMEQMAGGLATYADTLDAGNGDQPPPR